MINFCLIHCRNSEDDPERLWCICQQPHNNRFMICCDSCLDWYHGKCVGITKKMGKEMEEVGNEWRCPTCRKKEKMEAASEKTKNELEQKLEAKLQKENEKQLQQEKKQALKKSGAKKKLGGPGSKKRPGSAMSNDGKEEKVRLLKNTVIRLSRISIGNQNYVDVTPSTSHFGLFIFMLCLQKIKERTCFVCGKPPRAESIFCSDDCIGKHVESAKDFLLKTKPKPASSKRVSLNYRSV